jgi:hypothetical protein
VLPVVPVLPVEPVVPVAAVNPVAGLNPASTKPTGTADCGMATWPLETE